MKYNTNRPDLYKGKYLVIDVTEAFSNSENHVEGPFESYKAAQRWIKKDCEDLLANDSDAKYLEIKNKEYRLCKYMIVKISSLITPKFNIKTSITLK